MESDDSKNIDCTVFLPIHRCNCYNLIFNNLKQEIRSHIYIDVAFTLLPYVGDNECIKYYVPSHTQFKQLTLMCLIKLVSIYR